MKRENLDSFKFMKQGMKIAGYKDKERKPEKWRMVCGLVCVILTSAVAAALAALKCAINPLDVDLLLKCRLLIST